MYGDDIVARQIRQAAESESDPNLKSKLWDEYEKYLVSAYGECIQCRSKQPSSNNPLEYDSEAAPQLGR